MRAVLAILALLVLAPSAAAAPNVEIRRTSHGIPHIKAKTFYGAAYGYGYALAQDNLCEMAETYVTVNGERSRFFGPDGSYESRGNGAELQQPRLGLLLPAHQGRPGRRGAARAAAARRPAARDPRGRARLRGRLQTPTSPRSA